MLFSIEIFLILKNGAMKRIINSDIADFLFRAFFCLIFVGLGGEHIFSDTLIQHLMPEWMPYKRLVSLLSGIWLVGWGGLIFIGYKIEWAAYALGLFLVVVTFAVHVPGVLIHASTVPEEYYWMWDILQRSNLVKNICLLGVCFHLLHHKVGKFSLEYYLREKTENI